MNIEEYIESGILELYVAGCLSDKENKEVFEYAQKHLEIQKEIECIERTVVALSRAISPTGPTPFQLVAKQLQLYNPSQKNTTVGFGWLAWAAALLIIAGALWWTLNENSRLNAQLDETLRSNDSLVTQITIARQNEDESKKLLAALRSKDIISVTLKGQELSKSSYTKVFWNKAKNLVYVDVQGLPDPPEGKEYQLWSLTLDPLSPTSLGLLSNFKSDTDKVFTLENTNESEAFGITLEPKGGSSTPTLNQLYTLGTVPSI